jgi:hypothetical protein
MGKKVGETYFTYLPDKRGGCWYYLRIKDIDRSDVVVYWYDSIETNDPETERHRFFTDGSEMDELAIKCDNVKIALKLKALHGA